MAARIVGVGKSLPEKVLTNAEIERMVETSDEWIVDRTGIRERRIAAAHERPPAWAPPPAAWRCRPRASAPRALTS